MKINTINKNNKNLSSLSTNSNSAGKNIKNKLSSSDKKNIENLNSNIENKKNMAHSNSQLNINTKKLTVKNKNNKEQNNKISTSKKEPNDKSLIIDSELLNIENIDISAYTREPFLPPKKKFDHNFYTSKLENTINFYNEIKEEVNKIILDTDIPKKAKNLQIRNFSLLDQFDKLNFILDNLVERKRFSNKKKNTPEKKIKNNKSAKSKEIVKHTSVEINNKLLNSFKKQYDNLSDKYKEISQDNYVKDLKGQIESLSIEISNIETTNKQLKTDQFKAEFALKKNIIISTDDSKYKKHLEQLERYENEYVRLSKRVPPAEANIKKYDVKINELNEKKNDLIKIAKEMYNLNNPEEIIVNKKHDYNYKEKLKYYQKKKELEKKILEGASKVKKYNYKKNDNGNYIKQLEENKIILNTLIKDKKELLDKLNQTLNKLTLEYNNGNINNNTNELNQNNYKKIDNTNKKENKSNDINNNISSLENQSLISPIKPNENMNSNNSIEINDNKIENMISEIKNYNNGSSKVDNNRYDEVSNNGINKNLNKNNHQTYNKKMVLEQLDIQKDKENLIKMDKSISLKKNKFKPNFSFTLNDNNIKEKKINLSMAVLPKTNNTKEKKNESEGEIKEEIQVNNNKNDEKIMTNLSQNISMDKIDKLGENENEQEKNRENDLNTVPYDDKMDRKKKNNQNGNNEENNYNFTNSNEQEHIFEKEQVNMQDNRDDDIVMDLLG